MKRLLIFLPALILLAACASSPTPRADAPVDSHSPSNGSPPAYAPRPNDDELLRGEAYVDSVELLTLESYPLQFALILKGSLPTPCHELRVMLNEPFENNKVILMVYSVADPNSICVQMLQPFEQTISLGSFPSGHYALWVNGKQVAEFDA
ncbi:MAG: hypothetical protein HFACDABA_01973 [Anaerolineales bacterium]|nr:hypothetical protein [Anaerolineales bacterium]